MRNLIVFSFLITSILGTSCVGVYSQALSKKVISESEKSKLANILKSISENDQKYRSKLAKGTLDEELIAKIDAVYESKGIEAGVIYQKSLNLELSQAVKDSLWQLQSELDLQNHLTLKGLWDLYGYLPASVVKEHNYVQSLLLLHPPMDWDVATYLEEYSSFLLLEVKANRMPAEIYANFVDNMKAKILKQPQLYGTNQQFDLETKQKLPAIIADLEQSNAARLEIGLPKLKEGEYRIIVE